MSHLDPALPTRPAELRKFGLLVGVGGLLLATLSFLRHKSGALVGTFGAVGALLVVGGLLAPKTLGPVYRGWMRFALLLSKVTTPVFMGVIYFALLTSIGLLMRLFGKRPLGGTGGTSAWVVRPEGARRSALERQF